jgi:hypothetical protein
MPNPARRIGRAIAEIYVGLGDNDQAFAWLDRAYEDRFPIRSVLKLCLQDFQASFDPRAWECRSHGRFVGVLNY